MVEGAKLLNLSQEVFPVSGLSGIQIMPIKERSQTPKILKQLKIFRPSPQSLFAHIAVVSCDGLVLRSLQSSTESSESELVMIKIK